jgi:hypothetical protein
MKLKKKSIFSRVTKKEWTKLKTTSKINTMEEQTGTIRVTGLGHKVTLKDLPSSTTVTDLRTKVYEATGLPPRFQKLIGPQKLNINYYSENDDNHDNDTLGTRSLSDLGIKDRTKLMLLHSPLYQNEKDSYETLKQVEDEIVELERSIRSGESSKQKEGFFSEMVTRVCCRLDAIDVAGSKELRAHRKELIQTAEGLEGVVAEADAAKQSSAE